MSLYTPEQIAEFVAAAQGKTFTAINWCIGKQPPDPCDPCVEKFRFFYFALIPGTAEAFYTKTDIIAGTLGNPPVIPPFTPPGSPPGWPAFYGDGSGAGTVHGYLSGAWGNFGGGATFVANPGSPFPPSDPRTPGVWTVTSGYSAPMAVQGIPNGSFIEFPVSGDKIKALHAEGFVGSVFYTQEYTDANWGVGYNYNVDHILVVEVPITP